MKTLGVKCSFDYTRDLFLAQEKNYSLWGVKKLLEHYGIKVTPILSEAKSIDALEYPFVCQTKEGMTAFTRPPKDIPAFLEQWDGYALLCDASHAQEPHYLWYKLKIG